MLINDVNADHDLRTRLMRVCRRWRAILAGLVAAWNNIFLSTGVARNPEAIHCRDLASFTRVIERTAGTNLEITVRLPPLTQPFTFNDDDLNSLRRNNTVGHWISHCERLNLIVPTGSSTAILDAIFSPASSRFEYLACLTVLTEGVYMVRDAIDSFLDAIAATAVRLHRLELDSTGEAHIVQRLLCRRDILARIREFMLPATINFSAWDAMPNLTDLYITSKPLPSPPSINLSRLVAPMLIHLRLEGGFQRSHIPPPHIIRQLKWFELRSFPLDLVQKLSTHMASYIVTYPAPDTTRMECVNSSDTQ
ncbi:hypothetical protein M408DRAFT_31000 [Serendipita vermifera MAFF 305830]|uniref:F-box domain-containing protein n=1 Tax=Serendipita vermifera MAFF 305830 TaxID=933852 RepID=A0A0C3AK77_SERVB|nr:hypothetical protein M408DRAFT_31000 [Serendipita vermifera MAFF 305830]